MGIAGIVLGVVLFLGVSAGFAVAPRVGDYLPFLITVGRGRRRWWLLAGTILVTLLVALLAGLSTSESRPFTLLLVLGVVVPLVLSCAWAWGLARRFS
jgi:hypothetical protein